MHRQSRRLLLSVPITHSREDMGSLGRTLPVEETMRQRADAFWRKAARTVQTLRPDWTGVRIYQDGLPDVEEGVVNRIVQKVQSPNYQVIRWLVDHGAVVVGTESPALLREEYELLRAVFQAADPAERDEARRRYARRAPALLVERDAYIACRIADTLAAGETGILFLGQAHHPQEQLPEDIAVEVVSVEEDP